MEILEFCLRYLAWPFAVIYLGRFFIIKFGEPISNFLQRIIVAKGYGVSFEAGIPLDQQEEEITKLLPPEEEIKKDIGEEYVKKTRDKYMELLEKYLFERTLNVIYGTQMDLLEFLLKKGTLGEKYSNLKRFYFYFIVRSKLAVTRTETQYFGFLKNLEYIEYVGEGEEQIVKITPDGLDFLSYIKRLYPTTYRDRHGMQF